VYFKWRGLALLEHPPVNAADPRTFIRGALERKENVPPQAK